MHDMATPGLPRTSSGTLLTFAWTYLFSRGMNVWRDCCGGAGGCSEIAGADSGTAGAARRKVLGTLGIFGAFGILESFELAEGLLGGKGPAGVATGVRQERPWSMDVCSVKRCPAVHGVLREARHRMPSPPFGSNSFQSALTRTPAADEVPAGTPSASPPHSQPTDSPSTDTESDLPPTDMHATVILISAKKGKGPCCHLLPLLTLQVHSRRMQVT